MKRSVSREARRPKTTKATRAGATRAEAESDGLTPLASRLRRSDSRVAPLDLLKLATETWLRGERLDVVQLAHELGVSRATVFRWIGSRELLYGEVLSHVYARQHQRILRAARGEGLERLVYVTRHTLKALHQASALRTFIEQDPELAIRVLTSKSSPVQARSIALEKALLREVVAEGKLRPQLDIDTLAYLIVRICESFLYADVLSGRTPDIEKAVTAIRILAAAEEPKPRKPNSSRRTRSARPRAQVR